MTLRKLVKTLKSAVDPDHLRKYPIALVWDDRQDIEDFWMTNVANVIESLVKNEKIDTAKASFLEDYALTDSEDLMWRACHRYSGLYFLTHLSVIDCRGGPVIRQLVSRGCVRFH